jgi:hypothetical protein
MDWRRLALLHLAHGEVGSHYSFEHRLLVIMTDAAFEREKKEGKDALNGL